MAHPGRVLKRYCCMGSKNLLVSYGYGLYGSRRANQPVVAAKLLAGGEAQRKPPQLVNLVAELARSGVGAKSVGVVVRGRGCVAFHQGQSFA